MRTLLLLGLLVLAGCDDEPGVDAGSVARDGGQDAAMAPRDAGGPADAGVDAGVDAGAADAGAPDGGAGLGIIRGACGAIDEAELLSASPFELTASLEYPVAPGPGYDAQLGAGARELLMEGTLGGSSIVSEAVAFDYLARCEGASLQLSESEVIYRDPDGGPDGRTDMVVTLDGLTVGVSVVRGFRGAPDQRETAPYDLTEAQRVLGGKLESIRASSDLVDPSQAWVKQLLVVLALRADIGATLGQAWDTFSDAERDGTVLLIVVTDGEDGFIYDNTLP